MPLSEHEQRILDEIERRLAAEDPKFARSAALSAPRNVWVKRVKRAAAGFILGLGLLVTALVAGLSNARLLVPLGVAGFGVMLAAVLALVRASKHVMGAPRAQASNWFGKAEERWRKRFERGDGRS